MTRRYCFSLWPAPRAIKTGPLRCLHSVGKKQDKCSTSGGLGYRGGVRFERCRRRRRPWLLVVAAVPRASLLGVVVHGVRPRHVAPASCAGHALLLAHPAALRPAAAPAPGTSAVVARLAARRLARAAFLLLLLLLLIWVPPGGCQAQADHGLVGRQRRLLERLAPVNRQPGARHLQHSTRAARRTGTPWCANASKRGDGRRRGAELLFWV